MSDWPNMDDMSKAEIKALDADLRAALFEHRCEELTTPPSEFIEHLACLTPQQRAIVGRLLQSPGKLVSHDAVRAAADHRGHGFLCGQASPRTQIGYARKRLREAGIPIRIENVWGEGYKAFIDG